MEEDGTQVCVGLILNTGWSIQTKWSLIMSTIDCFIGLHNFSTVWINMVGSFNIWQKSIYFRWALEKNNANAAGKFCYSLQLQTEKPWRIRKFTWMKTLELFMSDVGGT